MQRIDSIKKDILSSCTFKVGDDNRNGQSTGTICSTVTLVNEEMDFSIRISAYRSVIKNKQMAITLFSLYLDEVIK